MKIVDVKIKKYNGEEFPAEVFLNLKSIKAIDSYTKVINQCDESFHLSVDAYKEGLTSFTNVVDAQINSLTYANSLISAKGDALVNLVDLYKALGG